MPTQHSVEAIRANLLEEPLDIGPRQTLVGIETHAGVLHHHCPACLATHKRLSLRLGTHMSASSCLLCGFYCRLEAERDSHDLCCKICEDWFYTGTAFDFDDKIRMLSPAGAPADEFDQLAPASCD